jgi:hypothetical protein
MPACSIGARHWTTVEFHNVEVKVPNAWPVKSSSEDYCMPPNPAVYLGDERFPASCTPRTSPRPDSASVMSFFGESRAGGGPPNARRRVVGGQPVFRDDSNGLVFVPWLNYSLVIGAHDRHLATRIADSVRPIIAPPPIVRDGNPSIDGQAVEAHIFYSRPPAEEGGYEVAADVIDPSAAAQLAAGFATVRERLTPSQACAPSMGSAAVTLRYASRFPATTTALVNLGDCGQLTTGDGTAWKLTSAVKAHLLDLLKKK